MRENSSRWRPARSLPVLLLVGVVTSVGAAERVIEYFTSAFIPQTIVAELGDTVTWVRVRAEHTVTSGSGPDDPQAGARFDVLLTEERSSYSLTLGVEHVEGVTFFCRNHPRQRGFVQVSRGETTVRVAVVDNVFIPHEVYIFAGDSILWEHEFMEDFHTVTSGLSSRPEDNPAALFDVESSCAQPIFVYTFERGAVYPYFCRPHESMGMTGTVHVQDLFVRGDASGDGAVDIGDAVAVLSFLFLNRQIPPCVDALDADDDGVVNITDAIFVLGFLFQRGGEMPPPFPLVGPDRTEDGLRCMPADAE
ncbi:MAG: plastocyanin/azurin family copper-binding protein [Planctomycetota bacterium]|nr:plastocyanin/azurin family copper-binding protein [Planctomycetota bacterium]